MNGIGGNTVAEVQIRDVQKNAIGEDVTAWVTVQTLTGWLDLSATNMISAGWQTFHAKVQDSTHIFIADYTPLDSSVTVANSRLVINGEAFDVRLYDNPMGMKDGSQWEIYLKHTGVV